MHHALFTGWETQKIIQIISRPFLVSGSMSPASKSPAELIMEIKFLKWPSKNASHSTGEGLFHQQGWYLSLLTYIYQTELWTSKRHFSAALTQFPCPNTLLGVLLKPWHCAFTTCHRTCCAAMQYGVGKSNGLGQQHISLQRLLLWWAKQFLCVPAASKGLICIFLSPKLWGFCVQNTNNVWPQQITEGV